MYNNIFTSLMNLANQLNSSSISKLQKTIDNAVEKYNKDGQVKPLELADGAVLVHSESIKYSNGNLVPEYVDVSLLDEDAKTELQELHELHSKYADDNVRILNYLKAIAMKTVVLTDLDNEQLHQIFFDVLPDFILADTNLMRSLSIEDDEVTKLQKHEYKYSDNFISAEKEQELKENLADAEVFELIQMYYSLDLLTNF